MLEPFHIEALGRIARLAAGAPGLVWALTGSTSFALQGMPVTAHDIDIQTDRDSAYRLGGLLADCCIEPVRFCGTETIRSHFGRFVVGKAQVEVMGDIEKRQPGGAWEGPPSLPALISWVELAGLRVPVLSLEYEAKAYRLLGRAARAEEIERYVKGD